MKNHVMKTNRAFKEFCVLGGLAYSVCGVAQERPNIIVFLVDDMGLMDTSVPFLADESGQPVRHPLNDWYHTPNMERLAKQGICFSTFYAQSVSSPSRASIMTGQNATRHGVTNWINAESNNRRYRSWTTTRTKRMSMVRPEVSISRLLLWSMP